MAEGDQKFATKTTFFAPLTAVAEAFSPETYARPDYKIGKLIVAKFNTNTNLKFRKLGVSYTKAGMQQQQPEDGGET